VATGDPTAEVTAVLQQLIRNACVNDGTLGSGHESRSADYLANYLGGVGLDIERYEPAPGRASIVARRQGRDPAAPTLILMGHTDVVPYNEDGWQRDPIGGELVDGFVWGRGAVDMLNLTASMAVATRRLAERGWNPDGTLVYLAVADEEARGVHGAHWLVDHERDAVAGDFVVTEFGGFPRQHPEGPRLPVVVAEKGPQWATLRVHGTPGHGSMPYATDNALVTAAEVVRRLATFRPRTQITEIWRRFVASLGVPGEVAAALLDADRLPALLASGELGGLSRMAHACTHTTISPNVVRGGTKINMIPDLVEIEIDIRTMPGERTADVRAMLDEALGELADRVAVTEVLEDPSSESSTDTPLWRSMERVCERLVPRSALVPMLATGATDARFFRRLGVTAYGFGLFSPRIDFGAFSSMFHGHDERVDQESLRLSTQLWEALAEDLLGA
jgi:acetylornithine deacetylase/succinyl-diaminopimelate desuccinylase-like protein